MKTNKSHELTKHEIREQFLTRAAQSRAAGAPATINEVAAWYYFSARAIRAALNNGKLAHRGRRHSTRIEWADAETLLGSKKNARAQA